jgi:hypothetical protein
VTAPGADDLIPSRRFPAIGFRQLRVELAREREQRARLYPQRVDQGRMTAADANRELEVIAAIAEDLDRMAAIGITPPASNWFSWHDRRAAIDRELRWRRQQYPQWIESGRLGAADAEHRIACLEAIGDVYDEGFDWRASNGALPDWATLEPDPAANQARHEWDAHWLEVEARRRPPEQEELFT